MHIGLTGAIITALDGVVEKTMHAVAVILVILRSVDAALSGNRVGATRAVVIDKVFHFVAELSERGGGGSTGEAGSDNDDLVFALVGRINELERLRLVRAPLGGKRTGGNFGL